MFGTNRNWPLIIFIMLLLTVAALSFSSKRGWIKLGQCHGRGGFGCRQQPSADATAPVAEDQKA